MEHDEHDDRSKANEAARPRLAYDAPRILEEAAFETLAMACGKITGLVCRGRSTQFS